MDSIDRLLGSLKLPPAAGAVNGGAFSALLSPYAGERAANGCSRHDDSTSFGLDSIFGIPHLHDFGDDGAFPT